MLQKLIREGRLELFEPELGPGGSYRRRMFLHPDVSKWLSNLKASEETSDYAVAVHAMLKAFVTGEDFDDDTILKLMKPVDRGIYSLRIVFVPQHRIFGGFLRAGEFAALSHSGRDALGKGQGFKPILNRVSHIWRSIFGDLPSCKPRSSLLEDFCDED